MSNGRLYFNDILKVYVAFSFMSALLLWIAQFLTYPNFFNDAFYSSLLLVGSYFFFVRGIGHTAQLKESYLLPGLFLLQIISLIGISFVNSNIGGIILALIPYFFGTYFFLALKEGNNEAVFLQKAITLLVITLTTYFMFYSWTNINFFNYQDTPYLLSFAIWALGTIYYSSKNLEWINLLKSDEWKDGHHAGTFQIKRDQEERFFFHDLINQTHGLLLYINHKVNVRASISYEEARTIIDEVKLIQILVKDYFGHDHKNLAETYDYVSFEFARKNFYELIRNYLSNDKIDLKIEFSGNLVEDQDGRITTKDAVHYSSFSRIMTNLVKNIAEAGALEVKFIFDYTDEGLTIQALNRVLNLKEGGNGISKKLEDMILCKESQDIIKMLNGEKGLGIESVIAICEEQKGHFDFYLEGDYWVVEIFLPNPGITLDIDEVPSIRKVA